ncbi:PspC domain-containing protein [Paradesertivirga mongoliensis]|uniref:PspC domain-containing protein n=1 Tax=Paradesertivirga mongoliensis TaxID=2100740 RepID=A0ABW4ZII2_9SPHI|nr:PspC domain-containing protein [Pedobacter mongoliensis]
MNKTIIININGIVFHIEEDAYEILKSYMTEVKRHFAYSPDSDEIVTDIENRLAEMFNERLAEQSKQVIVLADVEEITAQMGKASDFAGNDEDETFEATKLKSSRNLYKDSEDRMIGGVCAGLGHYFNIEAKWVRLITLISTLFTGIGLIPYLILWIVLPTAKTRQEKMSMKGEPINLQNFKKTFDEEAEMSKQDVNSAYNAPYQRIQSNDPIREIFSFIGKLLKLLIKILVALIIVLSGFALFALIIGLLFGLGFVNHTGFEHFPFNTIRPAFRAPIFLSAFLILVIPLLALTLFAVRVLINRRVVSRYGSFAMLILWLTGVGMGVYYGSKTAADFKSEARVEQTSELNIHPTLVLKLNSKIFLTAEDSLKYNIDSGELSGRVIYGDENFADEMRRFDLFIEKSDDGKLSLVKELSGRGRTMEDAIEAAQRVSYRTTQQDSVIQFDKYWSLTGTGLFRAQELDLRLRIPVNTRIIIDHDLDHHLRNLNPWDCRSEGSEHNTPTEWIMTEDGLKCTNEDAERKHEE